MRPVASRRRRLAPGRDREYSDSASIKARLLKVLLVSMPATKKLSDAKLPTAVWLAGLAARTVFIGILIVVAARVSSPQVEQMSSLYETPSDLLRVALGFAVCVWLAANVFIVPKDSGGYRTWARLGIILLPLALLCAFVVW